MKIQYDVTVLANYVMINFKNCLLIYSDSNDPDKSYRTQWNEHRTKEKATKKNGSSKAFYT
jgi:hypothetical protein